MRPVEEAIPVDAKQALDIPGFESMIDFHGFTPFIA
jgi:hypothetical protein